MILSFIVVCVVTFEGKKDHFPRLLYVYSSRNESRYRLSITAYSFFTCKWTQCLYLLIEFSSAASAEDKFRVRHRGRHAEFTGRRTEIDRLGVQDR